MKPKLLNTLTGLGASGALLALGLLCTSTDARFQGVRDSAPLTGIDSTIAASADLGQEQAQPRRRARATLSMPYFSFAQSLRPRG